MCHKCGNGVEGNVWGRGGAKRACGRGAEAVGSQHGTSVDKGLSYQVGVVLIFTLIATHVLIISYSIYVLNML
jgi:hypothetical protein